MNPRVTTINTNMSVINAKIFLYVALILALYKEVQSLPTDTATDIVSTRYNGSSNDYLSRNKRYTSKIFGGYYATEQQFPFMVIVQKLLGAGQISYCSGSIISSRWVLTAGHCLDNQPRDYLVVFGTTDKTGLGYDSYQGPGVSMMTNQAFQHPQFDLSINDIGLLYMPENIPFSDAIQPIQFAHDFYDSYFDDQIVAVIGWGHDSMNSIGTNNLKYAWVPIISNAECRMYWDVSYKHICTAPSLLGEACQGDSGSPLVLMENGQPMQVGVVSYGDGFCPSSKAVVYTRVSEFIPWIKAQEMMYMPDIDI